LRNGEAMVENKIESIDAYISQFSPEIQEKLEALRKVIKESAPEATEKISWQMPTFVFHGNLVHFAVNKHHIGFYPGVSGVNAFSHEASEYKGTKGSFHFPLKKPLPLELVGKIVQFRVAENREQAEDKNIFTMKTVMRKRMFMQTCMPHEGHEEDHRT
jgi:uncharacterized protein YdhG (YjbR/CyaY superfamily)